MKRPPRTAKDSTWFVEDTKGFAWLPYCSANYKPSQWWVDTCLLDPETQICVSHRRFFRKRQSS